MSFISLARGKSNFSDDFEDVKSSDDANVMTDASPESLPSEPCKSTNFSSQIKTLSANFTT